MSTWEKAVLVAVGAGGGYWLRGVMADPVAVHGLKLSALLVAVVLAGGLAAGRAIDGVERWAGSGQKTKAKKVAGTVLNALLITAGLAWFVYIFGAGLIW